MELCQEIQIHSGKNMSGCLWIWLNGSAWRTLVKMSCTVYTGNHGCGVSVEELSSCILEMLTSSNKKVEEIKRHLKSWKK